MSTNRTASISNITQPSSRPDDVTPSAAPATESTYPSRPVKMRRNMLGPSDPAVAKVASSQVAAEGKIQNIARAATSQNISDPSASSVVVKEPRISFADTNLEPIVSSAESSPRVAELPSAESGLEPKFEDKELATNNQDAPQPTVMEQGRQTPEDIGSELVESPASADAPYIQVPGLSSPSSGTQAPNPTPVAMPLAPSVLIPSATHSSPVLSNLPPDETEFPDLSHRASAVPAEAIAAVNSLETPDPIAATVSRVNTIVPPPNVSTSSKVSRRMRIVQMLRKILVGRRLLAILLGEELGSATHAQFQQAQGISNTVPKAASI